MSTVLLSCRQMVGLATQIEHDHSDIEFGEIYWASFPDGFPNLFIGGVGNLRDRDVAFLASFDTPATIFEQLGVIYALPRYGVKSLKVILPYFPTGTMERVEEEGQVATAMTLARMLSTIPLTKSGPAEIVIYDIHALQERFYFSDQIIPRFESGIPILKARIADISKVAIVYPDDGSWKRFGPMFEGFPQIICQKVRIGEERIVSIKEGAPCGFHAVIVDDLVQTGGTLMACKDVIQAAGAIAVSAYTTHGVFPQESWGNFVGSDFVHIFISDSCPATANVVRNQGPFEVLSLAPSIAQVIRS